MGPKGPLFYTKIIKTIKTDISEKFGFGVLLVEFWIRIRILDEKLHLVIGSNQFFIDFRKFDFYIKIQTFLLVDF